MNKFRTEVGVHPSSSPINLKSGILTLGSCFADAIGERLRSFKLPALVNPFGVIYNPASIHQVLEYATFNEPLPDHTYLHHEELYLNYNFHSELSAMKKEDLAARLVNTIGSAHYFLKDAEWVMLTYGTAWVYQRKDTGEIVANCHKLPSAMFTKSLMPADDIQTSFRKVYDQLKKFNPNVRVILTVSPVRHIKDTLELNSVSKSVLRVACHYLCEQYDDVEYYPAYEMMLDDLRDYRFYRDDMLHPSAAAEDYIWEKFMERYFSPEMKDFVIRWKEILSALRHRPFHPETAAYQQFLLKTLRKLDAFKSDVNVNDEMKLLQQQLIK